MYLPDVYPVATGTLAHSEVIISRPQEDHHDHEIKRGFTEPNRWYKMKDMRINMVQYTPGTE